MVAAHKGRIDSMSDTLNSPQGDGNPRSLTRKCSSPSCQTPSIPRKGTETAKRRPTPQAVVQNVRHPQFPARGRKRRAGMNVRLTGSSQTPSIPRKGTETSTPSTCYAPDQRVRHPQFPARGRKPIPLVKSGVTSSSSDTLNSPQGDGN